MIAAICLVFVAGFVAGVFLFNLLPVRVGFIAPVIAIAACGVIGFVSSIWLAIPALLLTTACAVFILRYALRASMKAMATHGLLAVAVTGFLTWFADEPAQALEAISLLAVLFGPVAVVLEPRLQYPDCATDGK